MTSFKLEFDFWLASLFNQSSGEVRELLQDKAALHFLIAWSIFESKCFAGFVKIVDIRQYSNEFNLENFSDELNGVAAYFHTRYQDVDKLRRLMYGKENECMSELLRQRFEEINVVNKIFLLIFVIYRYRNNIFHGNKGVSSWLAYREQIERCTYAMQLLVLQSERSSPTVQTLGA